MSASTSGRRLRMAGVVAALAVAAAGCDLIESIFSNPLLDPAPACGTFDFTADCSSLQVCRKLVCAAQPGPRMNIRFQFEPKTCDQTCVCREVATVQALRMKRPDNSDIEITAPQTVRTNDTPSEPIMDGWAIDRGFDADTGKEWSWGLYGMNEDESYDHDRYTPGSNTSVASLFDSPGTREEKSYSVDVIDVPVCIDPESPCRNHALGYFRWGWSVPGSTLSKASECDGAGWFAKCGSVPAAMCTEIHDLHHEAALNYHKKAVCLALQNWNANISSRKAFPDELIADVCSGP